MFTIHLEQRKLNALMKNFLGESVRFLRMRQGISAAKVSRMADLSSAYVTKVEHGDLVPSVATFSKIMAVLHPTDAEILCIIRALGMATEDEE